MEGYSRGIGVRRRQAEGTLPPIFPQMTTEEPTENGNAFLDTRNAIESRISGLARLLPHPNRISGQIRLALAGLGLPLHMVSSVAGAVCYSLNLVCDWLDGMSARVNNLRTKEGERLDPLVDKVTNAAYLAYLSVQIQDVSFAVAAAVNVIVDTVSQLQRGGVREQCSEAAHAVLHPTECTPASPEEGINAVKANTWGKVKMLLQSSAIVLGLLAGDNATAQNVGVGLLGASALLGTVGTVKRMRKKKQAKQDGK